MNEKTTGNIRQKEKLYLYIPTEIRNDFNETTTATTTKKKKNV